MLNNYARKLRNNPTDAEWHLWRYIRRSQIHGCKFRRQEVIGKYIVDFVCFNPKLIIELDGGQHQQQTKYDQVRTEYLLARGYKVLRFWNHDVFDQTAAILS